MIMNIAPPKYTFPRFELHNMNQDKTKNSSWNSEKNKKARVSRI